MIKLEILIISIWTLLLMACGGKAPDRPAPVLTQEKAAQMRSTYDQPTVPSGQVVGGISHYTCPNGHDGSAAAGQCVICGVELQHNQAWHDQNPEAAPSTEPNNAAEPPQNAAGVWHYTCPNGHEGGAGSAVQCQVCGTTLVHNQAYHS